MKIKIKEIPTERNHIIGIAVNFTSYCVVMPGGFYPVPRWQAEHVGNCCTTYEPPYTYREGKEDDSTTN